MLSRQALAIVLTLAATLSFAQESDSDKPFGMAVGIGTESFIKDGEPATYQKVSLTPDFALGQFGIGMDVTLHYRFTGGVAGDEFEVRIDDWVPDPLDFQSILALYLPKFRYIRYGQKGAPLYAKFGSIEDGTLGNGFIMGNYANTLLLPDTRILGLGFDLDGRLFDFPFVGLETFVGNLAAFDVIGMRVYLRPLITTEVPILKDLQIGTTVATDTSPYLYATDAQRASATDADQASILATGADFKLPLLGNPLLSMAGFGDVASINGNSLGVMIGIGGKLLGLLNYGAQLRYLGDGFLPSYFGATYDADRIGKFELLESGKPGSFGWYLSMGTSILDGKIVLLATIDGPLAIPEGTVYTSLLADPHLRWIFRVGEGLLPGFTLSASWDKQAPFLELFNPEDAAIEARINYKTGPAVLSLIYKVRWVPELADWEVSSGLESSIELF